jgi:circadian clock protein KaiC
MTSELGTAPAGVQVAGVQKAPTGITGFDEITGGGVPRGRPTLVAGAAGAGKTLFAMEFLVRGARDFDEPGVLVAFEESASDLATNVASLGFDLPELERQGKLVVDAVHLDPSEIVASGEFDLEGLFIRLAAAVDEVGAKRVVLDTLEILFSAIPDEAVLRGEIGRLFRWIKDRGLTAVVTAERGSSSLTRFGIEEYVSDCVVVLDHRVDDEISTRRLRVAKYRGSLHGTREYPFLITEGGLVVVPITSLGLTYEASDERLSTGIEALDEMLSGGIFRGSSVMVSGTPGTGKTSISASMAAACCERGERALFISLEESPGELIRNMRSIGIDLQGHVDSGRLVLHSIRSTSIGLEEHVAMLYRLLDEHSPDLVVLDAVGSLTRAGTRTDISSVLVRDLDVLKSRGITGVLTTLANAVDPESSQMDMSSLVDTWLLLRNAESNGERNRLLFIIKSRGSAHSNQVREFVLTHDGPELVDVFVGERGVLTGSARKEQQARDADARRLHLEEGRRRQEHLEHRSQAIEAQIADLRAQLAAEAADLERFLESEDAGRGGGAAVRERLATSRGLDGATAAGVRSR